MQFDASLNKERNAPDADAKRPPKDAPPTNEEAKGALNNLTVQAKVVVERILIVWQVTPTIWRESLPVAWICLVEDKVKWLWEW